MRWTRRGLLAGGAGLLATTEAFARARRGDATQVDAALRAGIEAHGYPGAHVAIRRSGEIVFSRGYGAARVDAAAPVTPRSVFRIGSITKQFAAAAAIRLASQGKLDLAAPVSRYLPFMARLKEMSLLELMHHTAGLHSDETSAPTPGPQDQIALAREIAAQAQPFDFDPGTAWLYSNANYIVLGAVIEAVTRTSLGDALSDLVIAPLRLHDTAMDHAADIVARRVTGYSPTESGAPPFAAAEPFEIADAGAAGAMRSTAVDLCRWHRGLLAGRLFDRAHVALMTAPGRLRDGRLSGANRFSPDDAGYGEVQYACGLLVSPPSDPHPSLLHYGYIGGFSGMLQTYLHEDVTVAVLCNIDPGPWLPFRSVRQAVVSGFL